ncbi:hypothetical protein PILCRDRAFT_820621 [Piloderma croceum F 1598]|uniref:Uncharacterized protein n=1 Tax=Piloderma croceum (strain F 1598) TaxID=765440 RepID=A0A0C3FTR9_PILCF|nr:hypothetical protein PILCRDRAFT_820621 [Piloderma croceum F 1598]
MQEPGFLWPTGLQSSSSGWSESHSVSSVRFPRMTIRLDVFSQGIAERLMDSRAENMDGYLHMCNDHSDIRQKATQIHNIDTIQHVPSLSSDSPRIP